ncbi:Na+/H+ antiporter [Promicromonospora sp. NPDC050262]|uniref:Na+/H+ antiporter n=1 Tax=Promicromonospora sp. NPDC050262 TaxID=3155036 RepID=UPI00340CA25C
MHTLELVAAVVVAVLAGAWLSRRFRLSEPVVLLAVGVLIGLTPLGDAELSPHVVLFLFLPALLYWEALNSSVHLIRSNLRAITLQATLLVIATAAAVAAVAHLLGLPWPIGLVLGAVLAPTDAVAVSAVSGSLPRRTLTVLRTESLLNDGTALVLLAVTLEFLVEGQPLSVGGTALRLAESFGGGIAIGAAVAYLLVPLRRRLGEPILHSGLSVATPMLAFLPAELLHVSGVLAVVTCGLLTSRIAPRHIEAQARRQSYAFWEVTAFLLNGALFVLIGTQIPGVVGGLSSTGLRDATVIAVLVALTVIVVRLAWFYTVPYVVRALDRRAAQRSLRISPRERLPIAWAGMRGAISLAAALTVPVATASGEPIEQRDAIVFITAVTVTLTLVLLGPTLPLVTRAVRLPADHEGAREAELVRQRIAARVQRELPALLEQFPAPRAASGIAEESYLPEQETDDPSAARALRTAVLDVKRDELGRIRAEGTLDDDVLRAEESALDAEAVHVSHVTQAP